MGSFSVLCHELRKMQSAYTLHTKSEACLKRDCEAELLESYFSKGYHFYINEQPIHKLQLCQLRYLAAIFLKMNDVSIVCYFQENNRIRDQGQY